MSILRVWHLGNSSELARIYTIRFTFVFLSWPSHGVTFSWDPKGHPTQHPMGTPSVSRRIWRTSRRIYNGTSHELVGHCMGQRGIPLEFHRISRETSNGYPVHIPRASSGHPKGHPQCVAKVDGIPSKNVAGSHGTSHGLWTSHGLVEHPIRYRGQPIDILRGIVGISWLRCKGNMLFPRLLA